MSGEIVYRLYQGMPDPREVIDGRLSAVGHVPDVGSGPVGTQRLSIRIRQDRAMRGHRRISSPQEPQDRRSPMLIDIPFTIIFNDEEHET